ncbi:MAG: hypothetical protein PHV63_03155 [Candidatus Daviesbacteria bacterium]|nr:hypothetical protein [Candidatus Daviesbacteria bacterium]
MQSSIRECEPCIEASQIKRRVVGSLKPRPHPTDGLPWGYINRDRPLFGKVSEKLAYLTATLENRLRSHPKVIAGLASVSLLAAVIFSGRGEQNIGGFGLGIGPVDAIGPTELGQVPDYGLTHWRVNVVEIAEAHLMNPDSNFGEKSFIQKMAEVGYRVSPSQPIANNMSLVAGAEGLFSRCYPTSDSRFNSVSVIDGIPGIDGGNSFSLYALVQITDSNNGNAEYYGLGGHYVLGNRIHSRWFRLGTGRNGKVTESFLGGPLKDPEALQGLVDSIGLINITPPQPHIFP